VSFRSKTPLIGRLAGRLAAGGCLLALAAFPPALAAYAPGLLLGGGGGGTWYEEPDTGEEALPLAALNLRAGWRQSLETGGYFGFTAAGRLTGYLAEVSTFTDVEALDLILGLPLGAHRMELGAGLTASAMGTGDDPAHLRPEWRAELMLGRGKLHGEAEDLGSWLWQPADVEDVLSQGARLTAVLDPSIRLGFRGSLRGAWEYWPDFPLYDGTGAVSGERRQDGLGELELGLEGLAGFFFDWSLGVSTGLRWSNANRYLTVLGRLEENSESNGYAGAEAGFQWSPSRALGLQLDGFLRQEWYLERAALTAAGADTGERLRVLSAGFSLRGDWTPNGRLFLALEGSAGRRFANDPAEERWNVTLEAGVEYSF